MALGSRDVLHLPGFRLGRTTLRFLSSDHPYSLPHVSTLRREAVRGGTRDSACRRICLTTLRHSSANDHVAFGDNLHRVTHAIFRRRSKQATMVDSPTHVVVGEPAWRLCNRAWSDR